MRQLFIETVLALTLGVLFGLFLNYLWVEVGRVLLRQLRTLLGFHLMEEVAQSVAALPKKRILVVLDRSTIPIDTITTLSEGLRNTQVDAIFLLADLRPWTESDPIKIFDLDALTPVEFEQIRAEIERLMVKA